MEARIGYDDDAHKYTVDGEPAPSVTQILDIVSKPALVPWASKLQYETTRGALDRWLASVTPGTAMAPASLGVLDKALVATKQAWRKKQGDARDIGKEAHSLIEWHSKDMLGMKGERPRVSDDAELVFSNWLEWAKDEGYKPIAVEFRVYGPLYGDEREAHPGRIYAGTPDALATFKRFGDTPVLADWKSSSGIYSSMLLQVEAYCRTLSFLPTAVIARLPKENPKEKPEVRWVPRDDKAWECFLGLRQAYDWLAKNK